MTAWSETPFGPPELEHARSSAIELIDGPNEGDVRWRVRRLAEAAEALVELDPNPALAVTASDVATELARDDPKGAGLVGAARASHLARRAAGDTAGAAAALGRLRETAEASGDVDGMYDATWLEFLTAVTDGDRFGVRRSLGALRSFATAGTSHRAVALHRSARCLAGAIADETAPADRWPDGTAYADDHRLRPVLAAWTAIQQRRPEDARFALDRTMEAGVLDLVPASVRPTALMVLGSVCAVVRSSEHVSTLLEALEPHGGTFIATGPQPVRWSGSVDLVVAELAMSVGDRVLANDRLDAARSACQHLRAGSMSARLRRAASATSATSDGTPSNTPDAVSAMPRHRAVTIRRNGSMWRFSRGSVDVMVRHRKGLEQLRVLLAEPGREHHCVDLVRPGAVRESGIEVLDERARDAYRARYEELTATIDEAATWNDSEREFLAREELSALAHELARGLGVGGRTRTTGSTVERARVNVTRTVRGAIARLSEHDPVFGSHLERSVRTGIYCVYEPDGSYEIDC